MTPAQRLAELREIFVVMHRDHSIGWYEAGTRFSDYAFSNAPAIAQRERELIQENARLKAVISEHDLCHEDGEVTAECFAQSCIAYQRQKFGRSPTEDQLAAKDAEIAAKDARIASLEKSEEVLSKVDTIATDLIGDHFDEKGYIKGDGVWRIRAIENAVREIREVWSEFRESEATDER